MKYFVTKFTALYTAPYQSVKVCDIPRNGIVEHNGEMVNGYALVKYIASRTFEGYVKAEYIEEVRYPEPYPLVNLANMDTPSQQDAAQYVLYMGNVQWNLCGELCVCSILDLPLFDFLQEWRARPLSFFQRVFAGGRARTTGIPDLLDMLAPYNCTTMTIAGMFTPGRMERFIYEGWRVIIGCKIDSQSGELRGQGIGHWVVIRNVHPTGVNRALVTIYNPFPNALEVYSWGEFCRSVGTPYGVMVRSNS